MRVELADNRLTGQDLGVITQYKSLETFKIGNNLIRNFDLLRVLGKCESLITLDLSANPVSDIADYRG